MNLRQFNKSFVVAMAMLLGYWMLSMALADYALPIFSLPIIGDIISLKPFGILQPYGLFIGGVMVALVFYYFNKQKQRGKH